MRDQKDIKQTSIDMLNDLICIHVQVAKLCSELADEAEIDEITKTLHTTVNHYQSTIDTLKRLVSFVENTPTFQQQITD